MKRILWKRKKILVIIAVFIFLLCRNIVKHTFSTERWMHLPEKRVDMVDDLLEKHDLVGMSREKVISLLGADTDTEYFKTEDNMVYYMGNERGLISIDSEWLVLEFQENQVSQVNIRRD